MQCGWRIAFEASERDGWLTKEDVFLVTKPKQNVVFLSKGTLRQPEDMDRVPRVAAADPLHVINNSPNLKPQVQEPQTNPVDTKRKRFESDMEGIRVAPGRQRRLDVFRDVSTSRAGHSGGVGNSKGAEGHDVLNNLTGVGSELEFIEPPGA